MKNYWEKYTLQCATFGIPVHFQYAIGSQHLKKTRRFRFINIVHTFLYFIKMFIVISKTAFSMLNILYYVHGITPITVHNYALFELL